MVNVFVLVTSVEPLTSFLHDIAVVTTHLQPGGQLTQVTQLVCCLVGWLVAALLTTMYFLPQLHHFLLQQLGPAGSHKALQQVRLVVDEVLRAALLTNEKQPPPSGPLPGRCVWCYQLLTFTLLLSPAHPSPVVIQVRQRGWTVLPPVPLTFHPAAAGAVPLTVQQRSSCPHSPPACLYRWTPAWRCLP